MPLKDLLAMYGYRDPSVENSNSSDQILNEDCNNEEDTEGRAVKAGNDGDAEDDDDEEEDDEEDEEDDEDDDEDTNNAEPDLKQFYTEMVKGDKMNNSKPGVVGNVTRKKDDKSICPGENDLGDGSYPEAGIIRSEDNATTGANNSENNEMNCPEGETSEENRLASGTSGDGNGAATGGSSRLLRSVSRPQSEEEEDDCDYSPDEEEWKKTIMVILF